MPALFFQILTTTADLIILLFIVYYLLHLRAKAKKLQTKEEKIETSYRTLVDEAVAKEKKILTDATSKADQIIADAETMSTDFKGILDLALQKITADMQKEAALSAEEFSKNYQSSLKQLSTASLNDFQSVFKDMKTSIEKETKEFHETQLASLQKELDAYKETKMKETEQTVKRVIHKVSEEILSTAIPLEEHQKLLIESMEKARKEGAFD